MTNPKKLPKKAKGDPCPHCGAHSFEILKEDQHHGVTIMRCLSCKGKVIVA